MQDADRPAEIQALPQPERAQCACVKAESLRGVSRPEGLDWIVGRCRRRWDLGQGPAVRAPEPERAVGLSILSGKTDIANVRVEFASGCVANFTASRVSTERVRKLRFFQPRQYISIDYGRQDVLVFSVGGAAGSEAQPTVNPQIRMAKPPITAEEPLFAEIRAFLTSVQDRSRPVVSTEDGRRALELALAILAEINRHAGRIGL